MLDEIHLHDAVPKPGGADKRLVHRGRNAGLRFRGVESSHHIKWDTAWLWKLSKLHMDLSSFHRHRTLGDPSSLAEEPQSLKASALGAMIPSFCGRDMLLTKMSSLESPAWTRTARRKGGT